MITKINNRNYLWKTLLKFSRARVSIDILFIYLYYLLDYKEGNP